MTKTDPSDDPKVSYQLLNSVLSARNWLARGLGQMFGGKRNLYDTFGYAEVVEYADMLARYKRQDIVSRIVNAYPDAVWTRPPEIVDHKKLSDALWQLDEDIGLFHYVNRADRLSGIGKYSVLLLGFDDAKTNSDLRSPVRFARRSGEQALQLAYVQAFGYGDARVASYEDDLTSPYFGMPKVYRIGLLGQTEASQGVTAPPTSTIEVHRSRVIHIADCLLDNEVNGYPILERVFNRLDDVEKTVGGSAEMFWLSGRKGMQIDVDKDTQFTKQDATNLKAELEDFANDLQRYIRTRGVNIKELGGQHINPEPVFNVIMSIISVATGIPQRIFIGSEQGKLASEQDRANWAIRIDERRKLFAEPKVLRPLLYRLQEFGVLPKGRFTVQWPEAFRMSPLERAQTAAQQARAATNVSRAMNDFAKPIEGVDYAMRRPTATVSSGGGFGGKAFKGPAPGSTAALDEEAKKKKVDAQKTKDDGSKPDPKDDTSPEAQKPEPVVVPTEEITIKKKELISLDEARAIIFARGELKTEGKIDGVMD